MADERRLVWDLPLRIFHWLLVLSLGALWATGEAGFDWIEYHMWLGYFTGGLILFRIIWGFVGPRHARFSNFLAGPATIWRYAKGLAAGTMIQTAGHNPLGGISVIVMLLLVGIQVTTGLFTSDDIIYFGPYNGAVSPETAEKLSSWHAINFNIILVAVCLHILAIAFYFLVKKQNLVAAMFHGKKPAAHVPEHEAITKSEVVKALIVILISAGLMYWIVTAAPPPPEVSFD